MKILSMKRLATSSRILLLAFTGAALCASPVIAAPITYLWSSPTGGDWGSTGNWSPNGIPGITGTTNLDAAAIQSAVSVTYTGNLFFNGSDANKNGAFTALSLTNGASLSVIGDLQTLSSSGNGGTSRNALIDTGSTLNISGVLGIGISNNGVSTSTWTVRGNINTENLTFFRNVSAPGGAILNVDGGKVNVTNTLNWGNPGASNSVGQINLFNGGELSVGIMHSNWTGNDSFYVNFVDDSARLLFGSSNWDESKVRNLISQGHILYSGSVYNDFSVSLDNGVWAVTVIPEPSSLALLAFAGIAIGWKGLRVAREM